MKTFILPASTFLVLAIGPWLLPCVTAQTNEPVIRVKEFRADHWTNRITLGVRGKLRTLRGNIEAVYKDGFLMVVDDPHQPDLDGREIVIHNYPFMDSLARGQTLSFDGVKIGTIEAVNKDGTPAVGDVLELWEYYIPPVPTQEQIAAQQKAAAAQRKADAEAAQKRKIATAAASLKFNQELAAKGDAYGQLRMGERYLTGDGVEKDEAKARQFFALSAAQGNEDASNALRRIAIVKPPN